MAASYLVVSQQRGVQVFAPNAPIDVMEVGFTTQPSQVFASVAVPLFNWNDDQADSLLQPIADGIEFQMARPEVVDMRFEQDITAGGLLKDTMVIIVQYVPPAGRLVGEMTAEVRVPSYAFGTGQGVDALINTPVAAAVAHLRATASL